MDTTAARVANILLGNSESAALLEMHFPAAEIEFAETVGVAIAGADFGPLLDDRAVPNWSSFTAPRGSILKFGAKNFGTRAYLAVTGGLRADEWLESLSTNLVARIGGISGRRLQTGDRIESGAYHTRSPSIAGRSIVPRYSRFPTVRIIPGSEFEYLTATSERDFLRTGFKLTNECDRMGYRLSGKTLHLLHKLEMVSSAATFGTIQLLPDGQLIVLMADHQTSGGYPRLGNIVPADLPLVAQCGPGDGISFEIVTIEEAEWLSLRLVTELNFLRTGCNLRNQDA
jgi:antagonist of KipI